jgi:hypothetical protein
MLDVRPDGLLPIHDRLISPIIPEKKLDLFLIQGMDAVSFRESLKEIFTVYGRKSGRDTPSTS